MIVIHTTNPSNEICRFTKQERGARRKLVMGIANTNFDLLEILAACRYRVENFNDTSPRILRGFSQKNPLLLFIRFESAIGAEVLIKI